MSNREPHSSGENHRGGPRSDLIKSFDCSKKLLKFKLPLSLSRSFSTSKNCLPMLFASSLFSDEVAAVDFVLSIVAACSTDTANLLLIFRMGLDFNFSCRRNSEAEAPGKRQVPVEVMAAGVACPTDYGGWEIIFERWKEICVEFREG